MAISIFSGEQNTHLTFALQKAAILLQNVKTLVPKEPLCKKIAKITAIAAVGFSHLSSMANASRTDMASSVLISPLLSALPNCAISECSDLDLYEADSRERDAMVEVYRYLPEPDNEMDMQEVLRLNQNNPKEKMLFLSAKEDENGALHPFWIGSILAQLAEKFDLKYKVVSSYEEICKEIEEAPNIGVVKDVIIHAHGLPDRIILSSGQENGIITKSTIGAFPFCFSKLPSSSRIVLFSCCTGASESTADLACFSYFPGHKPPDSGYKPIAQIMADHAQRQVIGASTRLKGSNIQVQLKGHMLTFDHPIQINSSLKENSFQVFKPATERHNDPLREEI